MLAYRN